MAAIRRGPVKRGLDENDELYLRVFFKWRSGEYMNHSAEKEGLKPTRGRPICLTVEENFENGFFKISKFGVTDNTLKLIPRLKPDSKVLGIHIRIAKKAGDEVVIPFYFPYSKAKNLEQWAKEQYETRQWGKG